jgi:SAM-dependent methyltransferase
MHGTDAWLAAARDSEADDLREKILTGFKAGKPFTPYEPTVALPAPLDRVLDFGCGVGRNFPLLSRLSGDVTGFDLPPMIARCRQLATDARVRLTDDWSQVRAESFDLVYASLVLQHVETSLCRQYLSDFAAMAPALYLLTRGMTDFGVHVLELVHDAGIFDLPACSIVEHDPATHQLRVLGRLSFEEARASDGAAHVEILLRRRP